MPEFVATVVVSDRGAETVSHVRGLIGEDGVQSVLECAGVEDAFVTALEIVRLGGATGRVRAAQFAALRHGRLLHMRLLGPPREDQSRG